MKNTYRTLGNPSGTVSIVKAFSLLAGVLLFCLPLSAQKLTVESLEYVPNDAAAASYETQMQDINGNFAGVVKVYIALDGVQFEGGGVLKQEKRGINEYWVWMAQGSNRLKVLHPNFLPLEVNFRMYEEVKIVKPKLTYKLVITVPKGEDVQKQRFTLRYTPADAMVVIDDQVVKGKNGVYEGEFLVGDHSYSIIKEGYAVDKGIFSLLAAAPKRLSVELEKLQETPPVAQTTAVSTSVAQSAQPALSPMKTTTPPPSRQEVTVEDAEIRGKSPEQICDLGKNYFNGTGDKPQDYSKALKYFTIAAERGNRDIMVDIGYMYHYGLGVEKDDVEAVKWYRKAAELGIALGQCNLGVVYENGLGVEKDNVEAVRWYRKAAEQGDARGQFSLGECYQYGKGVSKDLQQARYWYEKAAAQGSEFAKKQLSELSGSNNAAIPTPTTGANKTFTVNGVSFDMVYVEGGTFTMGATSEQGSEAASDEKPAHSVTLSSYYIGETEVTQELWQAVMGALPSEISSSSFDLKGAQRPVCYVRWEECQTFISKLNSLTGQQFRMPTEAQWEYAARGGNKSRGYKYSGSNDVGSVAWYTSNTGDKGSHDVKTKSPNELGIYDMSGNVKEWCQDWFVSYSRRAQTNPTGPSSGSFRIDRGGGWGNEAKSCRSSCRDFGGPLGRNISLGLRLAL